MQNTLDDCNKRFPLKRCNVQEGRNIAEAMHITKIFYHVFGGKDRKMIEDFLLVGKKNAISSQRLADLAGCKSIRELQQVIAEERAAGAVILSTCQDGGGYFLPQNAAEVREFITTLESRGKNTLLALKSARTYLSRNGG